MNIGTQELQKIGLTESEAKIYFFILNNPSQSTTEIAKKFNLTLSRISMIAKPLIESKVLLTHNKGRKVIFSIGNFDNLLRFVQTKNLRLRAEIEEREKEIQRNKEQAGEVIEKIRERYTGEHDVIIDVYEDEAEIEDVRSELLKKYKGELLVITNAEIRSESNKKLKSKNEEIKNINVKQHILYTAEKEFSELPNKADYTYLSYEDFFGIDSNLLVAGDIVFIDTFNKDNKRKRIVIKNQSFAKTIKTLLEYVKNKNRY